MGKSLILCELALIAGHRGRVVHCLQWDITLQSFNLPQISAVYPEIDGVTDPLYGVLPAFGSVRQCPTGGSRIPIRGI